MSGDGFAPRRLLTSGGDRLDRRRLTGHALQRFTAHMAPMGWKSTFCMSAAIDRSVARIYCRFPAEATSEAPSVAEREGLAAFPATCPMSSFSLNSRVVHPPRSWPWRQAPLHASIASLVVRPRASALSRNRSGQSCGCFCLGRTPCERFGFSQGLLLLSLAKRCSAMHAFPIAIAWRASRWTASPGGEKSRVTPYVTLFPAR